MYRREAELVNEQTLADPMNMNLKVGGKGGWDYANRVYSKIDRVENGKLAGEALSLHLKSDNKFKDRFIKNCSIREKVKVENRQHIFQNENRTFPNPWVGGAHNASSLFKMSISQKQIDRDGENNPMFGKRWICNFETKENKLICQNDSIPHGWEFGKYDNFELSIEKKKQQKIRVEELEKQQQDFLIDVNKKYKLYLELKSFKKFVEVTGYDKSRIALVAMFRKYATDYVAHPNQKRR